MLCQLFSTSGLLLSILPLSLQPLSHLLGLRMPFSFHFLQSSPLLFPQPPVFFLQHVRLLELAVAAVFFLLPNCLRLLTTTLFFIHPSYRLSLPLPGLPLASHLF
jgi:hypothetical protein